MNQVEDESIQYAGACDSLFTPRPLAPLYDLALQIKEEWANNIHSISSRTELFTRRLKNNSVFSQSQMLNNTSFKQDLLMIRLRVQQSRSIHCVMIEIKNNCDKI